MRSEPAPPTDPQPGTVGVHPADDERRVLPTHITICCVADVPDKLRFVRETLELRGFQPDQERALVFTFRRKDAEDYAQAFGGACDYATDYYHAARDARERVDVADEFRDGKISVLFATKAFGMGVDIRNIRYVFHMTPPSSIEDYVQEIGRVGRDRQASWAFLPFSDNDFRNVRTRLVDTQLTWHMVRAMHDVLRDYRLALGSTEASNGVIAPPDSFVVPADLLVTREELRTNLYGPEAARTRQRMLLHVLEEARRLTVGELEVTHWPVRLGPRAPRSQTGRVVVDLARAAGATREAVALVSESSLRRELRLSTNEDARQALFQASMTGVVEIPLPVTLDWTKWAEEESNDPLVRQLLRKGCDFLEEIRGLDDDKRVLEHAYVHPEYLHNEAARSQRRLSDPAAVRFDERKPHLLRLLRRVKGLRVTGNRRAARYLITEVPHSGRPRARTDWRATLSSLPARADSVLDYLRRSDCERTVSALYAAAEIGLESTTLDDLDLTLGYLSALGVLRLLSALVPTSVRVSTTDQFPLPFDTPQDDGACQALSERNTLRLLRLDALQVLTRVVHPTEQETFGRAFFDAPSLADARRVVVEEAGRVDPVLRDRFEAEALDREYQVLNPKQQEVVRDAQTQSLVVKAGPGTGKTRTLITCVAQRLVASDRIENGRSPIGPVPSTDVLVLAYTRVVVEELRHRIRRLMQELGRNDQPRIHTFHGYARWQLSEVFRTDVRMENLIAEFLATFTDRALPWAPVHVFVDEFQDITEERDRMLSLILAKRRGMLVTVIGDPDQSIYDYDPSKGVLPPADVHFRHFAARVSAGERSLQVNYRSERTILAEANRVFPRDLQPRPDAGDGEVLRITGQRRELSEIITEALAIGRSAGHQHVAVLFRTNVELYDALAAIRNIERRGYGLRTLGNGCRIAFSREINAILEELLPEHAAEPCRHETVSRVAGALWKRLGVEGVWEKRLVKHLLDGARLFEVTYPGASVADFVRWVREDANGNQLLYASRLRSDEEAMKELVLSTIHRTKGLEFDSVIVAPSLIPLAKAKLDEETRVQYVAVSRARKRLVLVDGPREAALASGNEWRPPANSLRGRRFDTIDGDGAGAFQLFGFSHEQSYIKSRVKEGDALCIRDSALYHGHQKLCGIAKNRTDLHQSAPLCGIFVSEVVRVDGFGEDDCYRNLYSKDAQAQGWCYVVNAAGYLRMQ